MNGSVDHDKVNGTSVGNEILSRRGTGIGTL